jgi:Kdo2-lipid IVA lauroyltransferase/acyltransferase
MYYLVYGSLYLLSLLPLRALYLLSDLAYFFVYRVARYRKLVVLQNLSIAFPEKTEAERKEIARKFYLNFTDNFVEMIKLLSVGQRFLDKHFIGDPQMFKSVYEGGKKCQVHLGHNFNWEIASLGMCYRTPFQYLAVYMPVTNKAIDRLLLKLRSKTGARMLAATKMRSAMLPYRDEQYLLALVADQNAGVPSKAYWFNFLGRPAPFVKGPEKAARSSDAAVIFAFLTKKKRGHYLAHFHLATMDPSSLPETELTKKYVEYLEGVIRANPEMWLWTHRRWKHEWKPEYGPIIA